jgi:hypothetical protein
MNERSEPRDLRQVESISGQGGAAGVEQSSKRTPSFPYYVIAISMGVPALLFGLLLSGSYYALMAVGQGRVDFRQLYAAGYMVRTGHAHELYDYSKQKEFQDRVVTPAEYVLPFIRPAYQSLTFVPLSILPFRYAYIAWTALNIVFLYFSLRLLEPWIAKIRLMWRWLPWTLVAGFLPIGIALMQGQDSIELLLVASAALALLDKRRAFTAGAVFGLGLFKFQIVLPVALLFLAWKRWRFSAGFVSVGFLLGAISFFLTGRQASLTYLRALFSIGTNPQSASDIVLPIPITLMPNVHGLVSGIGAGHMSQLSIAAVTASVSIALLIGIWASGLSRKGARNSNPNPQDFAVALTSSALVSYYFFIHDATILFLPLAVILAASVSLTALNRVPAPLWLICLLLFVSPVWFIVSTQTFHLVSLCILGFLVVSTNRLFRSTL